MSSGMEIRARGTGRKRERERGRGRWCVGEGRRGEREGRRGWCNEGCVSGRVDLLIVIC